MTVGQAFEVSIVISFNYYLNSELLVVLTILAFQLSWERILHSGTNVWILSSTYLIYLFVYFCLFFIARLSAIHSLTVHDWQPLKTRKWLKHIIYYGEVVPPFHAPRLPSSNSAAHNRSTWDTAIRTDRISHKAHLTLFTKYIKPSKQVKPRFGLVWTCQNIIVFIYRPFS